MVLIIEHAFLLSFIELLEIKSDIKAIKWTVQMMHTSQEEILRLVKKLKRGQEAEQFVDSPEKEVGC